MLQFGSDRNRLIFPIAVLAVWTAFGLFFGTQNYVRDAYFGKTASLSGSLFGWMICGYSWGILTVPVLRLVRRFSLPRLGWSKFFLFHIPSAAIFSSVQLGIYTLIVATLALITGSGGRPLFDFYSALFVREVQSSFLVYFAIISAVTAYDRIFRPAPKPEAVSRSLNNGNGNGHVKRIAVKDKGLIVLVDTAAINWIESYGNYVFLHTPERRHIFRETMAAMEKKLDPSAFLRIRRSAIVRAETIKELRPLGNGEYEIVLRDATRLTSTRRYRKNIEAVFKA